MTGATSTRPNGNELAGKLEHANHIAQIARLKPLGDRVLLRRVEEDDERAVKIADAYQPKSRRGEVLAMGKKAMEIEPDLSLLDIVLFGAYSAEEEEFDGEKLVLVSVHDIRLKL